MQHCQSPFLRGRPEHNLHSHCRGSDVSESDMSESDENVRSIGDSLPVNRICDWSFMDCDDVPAIAGECFNFGWYVGKDDDVASVEEDDLAFIL